MPHECTTCGQTFDDGSKEMLSGCPNCGGNKFQFQPAGRGSGGDDSAEEKRSPSAEQPSSPAADRGPAVTADEPASAVDADDHTSTADAADPTTDPTTTADPTSSAAQTPTADPSADDAAGATACSGADDEFDDAGIADDLDEGNAAQNDARTSQATLDEIAEARREIEEASDERLPDADERLSDVDERVEEGGRGTPQGPPRDPPSGKESEAFDISGAVGPDEGDPVEKQPVGGSTGEPAEPVTDEDTDLSALREELNDQFESIKITAPGQYELNLMELYDRKEYIISLQEDGRYVIEMSDDYGIDED
ncbi:OapC/ArvC family zinc-ribbon domain-containing protein [Halolamina salifodinae]|uniref:Putative nucleic acid-binding Zn-ribbon protein n=1 Tax=Halolamina salifodinae TaxID=1202767 RepID=A0A8T4H1W9_9EURY|nr:Zn-ribbon containing protein [Halolamina salifodinae]MBP1988343.1 putative nucleic acid-binding Zn-ribbon protein [Halolamina salifodinae]